MKIDFYASDVNVECKVTIAVPCITETERRDAGHASISHEG